MQYYWIASTVEIKTAVLPCGEMNTKIVIFSDFKSFWAIFIDFVILLVIFIDFLSHFIDHFYNIFRS